MRHILSISTEVKCPCRLWPVPLFLTLMAPLLLAACGGSSYEVLSIGGIPDQEAATLNRRFGTVADYLSQELGVKVKYVPSVSYAALVTGFEHANIHLAWFGGLTGVQARAGTPGAKAIAQRPRDTEFHSVFVVRSNLDVERLEDLRELTFTFGSESSTSGHLMPRHFLAEAGIDPDTDFRGKPSFSGSHDKTWKLVESGSFQAGTLNETVWQKAVDEGRVDVSKVRVVHTTPPYFDYNWSVQGDLDQTFGEGFTARIQRALMDLNPSRSEHKEVLDLFQAQSFIATSNENYRAIEEVARDLEIIR